MLPRLDRIQVCSRENLEYLASFLPFIRGSFDTGLRAGIDTSRYDFRPCGREPDTLLFLGSFRHIPNRDALDWFTRHAFPRVLANHPQARLIVVGSDPPPRHSMPDLPNIEMIGFVEDVRDALARYAVFVCPILSGSGVRVKLLEAFAAGIPVVSTRLGAEGLASSDGQVCELADDPSDFADKVVRLLKDTESSVAMTKRARQEVEENWDMARITAKLAESYRDAIRAKRSAAISRR
jgi:glycosyltransferase involved in cell wall biosynthesis